MTTIPTKAAVMIALQVAHDNMRDDPDLENVDTLALMETAIATALHYFTGTPPLPLNTDREKMNANVLALIQERYPTAVDWTVIDEGDHYAELLDQHGRVLGYLTEAQLTTYWNRVEGACP